MKAQKTDGLEYATITELLDRASAGQAEQLLFQEEKKNGRRVTVDEWRKDLLETAGRFESSVVKNRIFKSQHPYLSNMANYIV